MPTHALPAGSVNFPVNMPKELRLAAGRFADRIANMSLGRWMRWLATREVCGFTSTLRREADEIVNMDREGRTLFERIAADGRIDADERAEFEAYLNREEAADVELHRTTRLEGSCV